MQTRKPGPKRTTKRKKATLYNHAAFLNGVAWFGENWRFVKDNDLMKVIATNYDLDAEDNAHLLDRHRKLLNDVMFAIRTGERDKWEAFEAWQTLEPQLRGEATTAFTAFAKYPELDPSPARKGLTELDQHAFPARAAYAALRAKKKQELRPQTPDLVALDQLPAAATAFFETKKLYEDTAKLASSVVSVSDRGLPKGTGALIDILSSTASAEDKLKEARKKLDVFSASDFVNKVLSATSSTMKATADLGISYATKMVAVSEAKKLAKDVGRYKHVLGKFKNLADMAEKVGNVATAISIAANYAKFVKAIWNRDWEDVLSSGAELGLDVAGVAVGGGAAGAAMIAGSVIVVKAQLEAVHLAAEFIRWCKDETVRQAALKFVDAATAIAKGPAWDLVVNAEIVLDPDKAAVHEIATQQMEIVAKRVALGFRHLDSHATATVKTAIGGHRPVVAALGSDARYAMAFPANDVLSLSAQVDTVFKGVDRMARFVRDNYRN